MPLRESAHVPSCTYRVQLHRQFAFSDLGGLAPYFRALGISDFYLSPIFTATPGSLHGYDITDYRRVNPELGGGDGFDLLAARLRSEGCGILLDFVPNHMGIAGMVNGWWRDVLENGRHSPYAPFFDIHWKEEVDRGHPRVLVPVLEDHYGRVLEQGKITLVYENEFLLRYGDLSLPVNPSSYALILDPLGSGAGERPRAIRALATAFAALAALSAGCDPETARRRRDDADRLKQEMAGAFAARPEWRERLTERLREINGVAGNAASFDEMHELIERQHYRLARWQTGAHEINYRRFFAIDSLVGLHMERTDVFRESHELIARLVREGKVAGLRIDHIDGLRQPEDYLRRLQSLERPDASLPLYVLVEKILAPGELLPEAWPVQGTTGYEFISDLAGVLVAAGAEKRFDQIYQDFTGETGRYPEIVYEKKCQIIDEMFANAVSNLGAELVEILAVDRRWRDLTRHELTTAVSELVANLPVYRTYRRRPSPASLQDRRVLEEACAQALARNPRADRQPFEFVRDLLIGSYPPAEAPEGYRSSLLSWVLTFQQYTGAVMAKAVEDTAFYTYDRLVALNEVGGDPGRFGGSVERFHRVNTDRLAGSPHSLVTTSTHDTKMSEDARARLYTLSELADEWEGWLREWHELAIRHRTLVDGHPAPDALDLYRFYQILLGVWPLEAAEADEDLRARLREHFRKAVNEAKRHTSILQANDAYLAACDRFVDGVTTRESAADFLAAFLPGAQRVARLGMVNSLAQLVLKCTVPGIPDFYQGSEIWDFHLVDPDNRRAVDFDRRRRLLDEAAQRPAAALLENWRDGGIKLRVTQTLLQFRARHARLFADGDYRPVAGEGGFGDRLIAFTRTEGSESVFVVVPRLTAQLGWPPLGLAWDDTRLAPADGAGGWRELFTGRTFPAAEPLFLRALFSELPFAVLESLPHQA
jgi:(1->4)-alpha-D-glucan 1-alpha-D-glucosylmutase